MNYIRYLTLEILRICDMGDFDEKTIVLVDPEIREM